MKNSLKEIRVLILTVLLAVLLTACGGEEDGDGNSDPIANAGVDQNVEIGTLVTLDGSGIDADGDNLTFNWSFVDIPLGSSATLSDSTIENPTFTADKEGVYVISLTAFDGLANSALDSVIIIAVPWFSKSPMPTARGYLSTSVVNGKIYAIGGAYTVNIVNVSFTYYDVPTVEEYDPATDTWATKTPMPTSRAVLTTSAVNGKIYAIGGATDGIWGTILSTVEEYNPATDTWTTMTPMPTPRSFITSSVVNGKIYVFGGREFEDIYHVDEYDPAIDTWTTKTNRPSNPFGSASSVVNGKIYLIGGGGRGTGTLIVEEYDPATDIWTIKTSTPTERAYLGTAVVNGEIYAIGGIGDTYYSMVEKYDPATDTWTTKPSMFTARSQLAVDAVNGKIYAIGGENGQGEIISTVEEYEPN